MMRSLAATEAVNASAEDAFPDGYQHVMPADVPSQPDVENAYPKPVPASENAEKAPAMPTNSEHLTEDMEDGEGDHDLYNGPQPKHYATALWINFLGHSSKAYKIGMIVALIINPILTFAGNKTIGGWAVLIEFLLTLVFSLEAYPLQAGGLLVIEAIMLNLTSVDTMLHEIEVNLSVILMVIFMVAAIHFMKNLCVCDRN